MLPCAHALVKQELSCNDHQNKNTHMRLFIMFRVSYFLFVLICFCMFCVLLFFGLFCLALLLCFVGFALCFFYVLTCFVY